MTYIVGGDIQAPDYNNFAYDTIAQNINEIYADQHPGETLLPGAGFGYGQLALTGVTAGNPVLASEWAALFTAMRSCGEHQSTSVTPPVPVTNPVAGDVIQAFEGPPTMDSTIALLRTNSFNLDPFKTDLIPDLTESNPSPWSTSLTYTFQVDFGSWDNARFYFNSGGKISVSGVYEPAPTADEMDWQNLFATQFPVNMNWQTTAGQGGNLIANPAGFYLNGLYPGLTTTWQSIYQKYVGSGMGPYYATNYALVEAKLTNTAGTDGQIDFRITLVDGDTFPEIKAANRMTYTISRVQSGAPIPYPGGYTITSGGFVSA